RARGHEDVDARPARPAERLAAGIDVGGLGSRERGHRRALHRLGDRADALEVTGGGHGEAGLDHVDAEALELLGDLRLLVWLKGDPRRLLAVSKGGVEDRDPAG